MSTTMVRMPQPVRLLGAVLAASVVWAAPAGAHVVGSSGASAFRATAPAAPSPRDTGDMAAPGPCTERSASEQYRVGSEHDHTEIAPHAAACRVAQSAFLPLDDVLDDEVLGEMDAKAGIAAVAVTFPQAGVLFFDVSDPGNPEFLSRYESSECEGLVFDVNCGAFVDLAADGKAAYLSLQQTTLFPGRIPDSDAPLPAQPGVEVIDISNPRAPRLVDFAIVGETGGGSHTTRSHVVPEGFSPDARPGEYLFSMDNAGGIVIHEVLKDADGSRYLDFVNYILTDEIHDVFIANDPIDRRVYLYLASGFDTGFLVWDVTDPTAENIPLVAEWDITPQCEEDWYAHTIDVAYRGDRRYVTMPAELFSLIGEQTDEDRAEGCGETVGNGDKVGPLWIVDASDFSELGPANAVDDDEEEAATDERLRERSMAALVTTWTNAASREAGNLLFTPHNQQIVGDKIYLSGYHSGVTVLDASEAFSGKRGARPRELGFIVPAGTPTRPLYDQPVGPVEPFFSLTLQGRPLIWDQVFYVPPGAPPEAGRILAADMTGGFYAFREEPDEAATTGVDGLRVRHSRRVRRALRRGVRASVMCRTPCRLSGRLVASRRTARRHALGRRVVARGRAREAATGRVAMRLRFTREARRALADARSVRLTLVVTARDAETGRVTRLRRAVRLGRRATGRVGGRR